MKGDERTVKGSKRTVKGRQKAVKDVQLQAVLQRDHVDANRPVPALAEVGFPPKRHPERPATPRESAESIQNRAAKARFNQSYESWVIHHFSVAKFEDS